MRVSSSYTDKEWFAADGIHSNAELCKEHGICIQHLPDRYAHTKFC